MHRSDMRGRMPTSRNTLLSVCGRGAMLRTHRHARWCAFRPRHPVRHTRFMRSSRHIRARITLSVAIGRRSRLLIGERIAAAPRRRGRIQRNRFRSRGRPRIAAMF